MIPRDYQWEAVVSLWKYFEANATGNPVVVMPTGTGKSGVIAFFMRSVLEYYPTQKILMLTHVKELIEQDYKTLQRVWQNAPAGIYSSGLKRRDIFHPLIFAGIGSVAKRADEFGHVDLIIIDEAHLVSPTESTMYRKFINALKEKNPYLRVIGLTATAYRLKQGLITEGDNALFTDICIDLSSFERYNKFVSEGYLCRLITKKTQLKLDVDNVGTSGGEFIQGQLQEAVDKAWITEKALRESMEVGYERQSWLIFTTGVEHTVHVSEMLTSMGVPCGFVHGSMPEGERDQTLLDFKNGKYRALANANVLTTGYDNPNIDMLIILRPSKSPGLWVQILGRGTRPCYVEGFDLSSSEGRLQAIAASHKKDCLVLDFGGNTKRLGPINDPHVPGLHKKGKSKAFPPKECDTVGCNTLSHSSARFCEGCGQEFVFKIGIKQQASTDDVVKEDLPITEEFKVDQITYSSHSSAGKPTMLKVTYYCGLSRFVDWVCLEHSSYPYLKAKKWWTERTEIPLPQTVDDALSVVNKITVATSIRVWTNKKYPEILAYCYDGSHFGKQEVGSNVVEVDLPALPTIPQMLERDRKVLESYGDDIPF